MDFTELYVSVDDFWQNFCVAYEQQLLTDGQRRRQRAWALSVSESMTIQIAFQASSHRTFKHFYLHLQCQYRRDFPQLVSYQRFVEWMPQVPLPLLAYLLIAYTRQPKKPSLGLREYAPETQELTLA